MQYPNYNNEELLFSTYQQWLLNRTTEELNLTLKICEYEEKYFEDFTFKEISLCWNIYSFIAENFEELFIELMSSKWMCRFLVVNDAPEYRGLYSPLDRSISITRSYINYKQTILHEMIHAYEDILDNTFYTVLRENLLITLYRKLSLQISDLDQRIAEHSELYSQTKVLSSGGQHDLLFFLKTLDLDIRCNYPLGTVCGYGRDTGDMWC